MRRRSQELRTTSNPSVWTKANLIYRYWEDGRTAKQRRQPRYDGYKNHRRGETYNTKWHCKLCRGTEGHYYTRCSGFRPTIYKDNSTTYALWTNSWKSWHVPNPEWNSSDDNYKRWMFPFDDRF